MHPASTHHKTRPNARRECSNSPFNALPRSTASPNACFRPWKHSAHDTRPEPHACTAVHDGSHHNQHSLLPSAYAHSAHHKKKPRKLFKVCSGTGNSHPDGYRFNTIFRISPLYGLLYLLISSCICLTHFPNRFSLSLVFCFFFFLIKKTFWFPTPALSPTLSFFLGLSASVTSWCVPNGSTRRAKSPANASLHPEMRTPNTPKHDAQNPNQDPVNALHAIIAVVQKGNDPPVQIHLEFGVYTENLFV